MGDIVRSDSQLMVTLRRNRFNGSEVALSSLAASSNQNVRCNKKSTIRFARCNTKFDIKSGEQKEDCNALCINDNKSTEVKFCSVFRQMSNLPRYKHIDQVSACDLHLSDNRNSTESRVDKILTIYWKVLDSFRPLGLHLNRQNNGDTGSDLLELRLQALYFIENLDGYCNSISMLRVILKSPTFIAVMFVHDSINSMLKTS